MTPDPKPDLGEIEVTSEYRLLEAFGTERPVIEAQVSADPIPCRRISSKPMWCGTTRIHGETTYAGKRRHGIEAITLDVELVSIAERHGQHDLRN